MRLATAFFVWCLIFAAAAVRDGFDRWIERTVLPELDVATSVEVRDRNRELMRAFQVEQGLFRLGTAPDLIDAQFLEMLITYEDKRFYDHHGVDVRAALRAIGQAVWNGEIVSGGSTLTMQVARLLENSGTGALRGKLRQLRVAWALERRLSKQDILALYLTNAPYGGNIEGIRAATWAWFGREPHRLTPAQSALLIALPQSPVARRPDRFPSAAKEARDRILERVSAQNILDQETVSAAIREPVSTQLNDLPVLAPHLADSLRRDAPLDQMHLVTVDAELQKQFQALSSRAVLNQEPRMSIAILVADHQTGEVLASVGSSNYSEGPHNGFVDMTRALRSPGSTLKPLVYGMGFDQGLIHPKTLMQDRPTAFGTYAPQNFDGAFRGEISADEALRQSLNIPVVALTNEIGPSRLLAKMNEAGMQPVLPGGTPGLALSLGGVGVTLEDLVSLYATLANGGEAVDLRFKYDAPVAGNSARVLSRSAAWQVSHILGSIPAPIGSAQLKIAYKTGTSYGHRDAWAIGYDARHVIGVWMGRPDGTPVPGVFGGELAAPVLFEAFQRLKPETDSFAPPPPETLLLSNAALPRPLRSFKSREAIFTDNAGPELVFPPHGARLVDDDAGVTIKLRRGRPPFSVLANQSVVGAPFYQREFVLPDLGKGASVISIVDADGLSDRVEIWLE